ncbi:MAG: VacJ family lipoprotein [Methylomonas sp.]|jgi:phospholipid-binding lipoprotein MlaA|uniref:MlaA family lipoprotein n=1 Tax=Methylomonas sp. TaxID=418 RepID=UPI0025EEAA27|nr:VacJ family lipoprotein [Methylomonas sp.]MCK9606244.1 VacJ family lipoprotein [Methylomonas sp.]
MYTLSYQAKSQASFYWALFFSGALSITGCASTESAAVNSQASAPIVSPTDPYEGFNRSMYGFNMGLDRYLLKPVADSYKFITPDFMQTGVTNFFNNLKGINVVLNDLLQGKFEQSASDLGRFTTNSTIGLLGLFDVATPLGLSQNVEDFGQTLAVWGVDQGPYLVLPVLGPTTARDGGGIIFDKAANPGTYVPGTGIVEGINERANAEGALNFINEAALDPYVFTRESFLQYRNNLINDGKTDIDSFDLDIDEAMDNDGQVAGASKKKVKTDSDSLEVKGKLTLENPEALNAENATVEAFDSMSKSFDDALMEFEQASEKMDRMSKKRRYRRR